MKAQALLILMGVALLGGVLIILIVPDYNIQANLESNAGYFPEAPVKAPSAGLVTDAETEPADDGAERTIPGADDSAQEAAKDLINDLRERAEP